MAEIRKHQPQISMIGEAVRNALGETVRPVEPGAQPRTKTRAVSADPDDPFAPTETATTVVSGVVDPSIASITSVAGVSATPGAFGVLGTTGVAGVAETRASVEPADTEPNEGDTR